MSGQLNAPAALPLGKNPKYPLIMRLGGPQIRSGRFDNAPSLLRKIETRFLGRLAQSVAMRVRIERVKIIWNFVWKLSFIGIKINCIITCPGFCVTNKTGFGIWWSNLLDPCTTGYNSSQITVWHTVIFFRLRTILTSNWTPVYSFLLLQLWSELRLTVPSYNFSARIPRKTPSSVVKNACYLSVT
jgi:hypothetical protein